MTECPTCPTCGEPVAGAIADTSPDGVIRTAFVPCGCGGEVDPSALAVARDRLSPVERIAARTAVKQGLPAKVDDPRAIAKVLTLLDVKDRY